MKALTFLASTFLPFIKKSAHRIFDLTKRILGTLTGRKRFAIPFVGLLFYFVLVFILVKTSGDSDFSTTLPDKRVNDVTQINPIQVGTIIQPQTNAQIVTAIKSTSGPISIGGGRFSMGGQTGFENSLHIDMRKFNRILALDTAKKQITVQSGITWREVQLEIDRVNLSVKIMQTYANFTVGGSVSVNCHGRYIGHGPIISSVLELKIITANGDSVTASRNENPELFFSAIGGYGGIGIIAEVTLQLVDNVKVARSVSKMAVADYGAYFNANIRDNPLVVFQNGDLYPPDFEVINSVSWLKTDRALTDTTRVTAEGGQYWAERQAFRVISSGNFGKWIRKTVLDPVYFASDKVVWRNREASYDVAELEPTSRDETTYVLQEYFIPVDRILSFIPKMRDIFNKHHVNVINVSLRHAFPDEGSYLAWAQEEVFAFVVYYKQGTDAASRENVKKWTVEMTDAILSEKGRWYLPYQPHASVEQFRDAYPTSARYFEIKKQFDPSGRFTNKLIDKYAPDSSSTLSDKKSSIKNYFRSEEQTFLTVPEWYLVFNPKEYADFLGSGENPSHFPFYSSIKEYWKLYDRSLTLVSKAYPENEEYVTMLKVIGVSVTMEYVAKLLYEKSIGLFFSLFSNDVLSDNEVAIIEAHRAYSAFIYHTAWYEFSFLDQIGSVWSVSNTKPSSVIRKAERMLFFTAEFIFKAGYAQLIEWAAKSTYETPETAIYTVITSKEALKPVKDVQIVAEQNRSTILAIQRWGAFTEALLKLSEQDIAIHEIGGNDEIAVSLLVNSATDPSFAEAEKLYDSSIVTDPHAKRIVYLVHVNNLISFIRNATVQRAQVEHIYDY